MTDDILAELEKEKARLLEVVKAYGVQGVDTIHVIDALRVAVKFLASNESMWFFDINTGQKLERQDHPFTKTLKEIAAILGVTPNPTSETEELLQDGWTKKTQVWE